MKPNGISLSIANDGNKTIFLTVNASKKNLGIAKRNFCYG
jgi:hypothetical protein